MFQTAVFLTIWQYFYACYAYNVSTEYLIDTPRCKIPNINPFDKELDGISVPETYQPCTDLDLLTYTIKDNSKAILKINETLIPSYSESSDIQCCYCNISRNGSREHPDTGFSISECTYFNNSVVLEHSPVLVKCLNSDEEIVYDNVHSPITIKKSVREKFGLFHNLTEPPFSVLMVVIDSVSRNNFIRSMKKTRRFLLDNEFIELKGYNKIGDNTFPNAMGFLAGFDLAQAVKTCDIKTLNKIDECPLIWYDYKNLGYATAYAEDDAEIATFNYLAKGFTNPPTDYYFKPYVEAAESLNTGRGTYCAGLETSGERILNLARDFSETFLGHPSFGVFWMNTFSHDYINFPFRMDEKVQDFFSDIKDVGVLNNTIVILLSDHGIRFGAVRSTLTGWFEERTPINMISVPKRFQKRFPQEYENLKNNADKLTNNYDLFMTLQHILTLSELPHVTRLSAACRGCQSFFNKIPDDRTCSNASIADEWCVCIGNLIAIETDSEFVKNATKLVMDRIQNIFQKSGSTKLCEKYETVTVVNSALSEPLPHTKLRNLFVVFDASTAKSRARFLVTVRFEDYVSDKSFVYDAVQYSFNFKTCALAKDLRKYCDCV